MCERENQVAISEVQKVNDTNIKGVWRKHWHFAEETYLVVFNAYRQAFSLVFLLLSIQYEL